MNMSLSDFRVVTPAERGFSAGEARVGKTFVKFNNLAAAELGYPEYVRLLIGRDGSTLVLQPADRSDPSSIPFMFGLTANDLTGRKKWIRITNRELGIIIQEKAHWEMPASANAAKRFYAVPWVEQGALIFDLQKPIPARQRSSFLSADDILQTYKKAAQDMCLVPLNAMDAGIDNAQFISISA